MDSITSCNKHLSNKNLITCSVCGKFKVDFPEEDFVIEYGKLGEKRWLCSHCFNMRKVLRDKKNVDLEMVISPDGVYTKSGGYVKVV